MKTLVVLCCLWAVSFAKGNYKCYNTTLSFCDPFEKEANITSECSARYGDANNVMNDLFMYANIHISRSFNYLRLATHFGSFEKDRKGFEKLFRHLSDSTWEDGIELIKYITKRGGVMDFDMIYSTDKVKQLDVIKLNEIQGLAHALDTQKDLAKKAFEIHLKARKSGKHEPEVSSFLENQFLHKQADIIRGLAGHISDVKRLMDNSEKMGVSLFIFDEYLRNHS